MSPSGLSITFLTVASRFSSGKITVSDVSGAGVGLGTGAGAGAGVGAGVGGVLWQLISSAPDNEKISIIMHKINGVFISLYLVFLRYFTLGKLIITLYKGLSIVKKEPYYPLSNKTSYC